MPIVTTTSKVVKAKAQAKTTTIIEQEELSTLEQLQAQVAELNEALKPLKKQLEKIELGIMVAATGLKKEDEWKKMAPEAIQEVINDRYAKGLVQTEAGKLDYGISATGPRVCPKWEQAYTAALGEEKAAEVRDNTDPSYSYHINIAPAE